jgi:AP-3 complex subunit delta-1
MTVKYVALMSFQKIVVTHPHLVALHQKVLLDCVDDLDISIRSKALSLVVGMVNSDNLTTIVDKLLKQLIASPTSLAEPLPEDVDPYADSDDEDANNALRRNEIRTEEELPIPDDYRNQVICNILEMCSKDTYANLTDFEWYIDVLVKLVKACPMVQMGEKSPARDVSYTIGDELRNVAVRVKALRPETTAAAQSLVLVDNRDALFPTFSNGGIGVLDSAAWIVGEYAEYLTLPDAIMNSIMSTPTTELPSSILLTHLQALLKVFAFIAGREQVSWTPSLRTNMTLLMARMIYFLDPLVGHSDLNVHELAIESLELIRLASEAATGQQVSEDGKHIDPPLLLTQAVPALFAGAELKPVASGAMRKVQPPDGLDLDSSINDNLQSTLSAADGDFLSIEHDDFEEFYYQADEAVYIPESAAEKLDLAAKVDHYSYQDSEPLDPDGLAKKKAERRDRNKDDPFYIPSGDDNSAAARLHNIIQNSNGDDLDIDSIPIMDLNLEGNGAMTRAAEAEDAARAERKRKSERRKKIQIVADTNLGEDDSYGSDSRPSSVRGAVAKTKKSLLYIDSSGLGSLSLEERGPTLDIEQREEEERALKEVERLRLEMQRAAERIQAREEETVIKKKKKKKPKAPAEEADPENPATGDPGADGQAVVKKKKKKKSVNPTAVAEAPEAPGDPEKEAVRPKRKKKRVIEFNEEAS